MYVMIAVSRLLLYLECCKSNQNAKRMRQAIPFDTDEFLHQLQMLMTAAYDYQEDSIRDLVAEVVPTYHPAGEHGS